MALFESTLRYLASVGFIFAVITAVGQLIVKQPTRHNYLISAFAFCLAMIELTGWNTNLELHYVIPQIALIDIPFLFATGPFLLLIVRDTYEPEAPSRRPWKHFVIPLWSAAIAMPYYMLPAEEKATRLIKIFQHHQYDIHDFLYVFGIVVTLAYTIAAIIKIRFIWRGPVFKSEITVQLLTVLLFISFLVAFSAFLAVSIQQYVFMRLSAAIIAVGLGANFLIIFRYPDFYHGLLTVVQRSKYKQSHLDNIDLDSMAAQIKHLIEKEQIFKDEEITLGKFAEAMNVSVHQLSQYLNEHLQKNFSSFINEYRATEAEKMMAREPEMSIQAIAYKVGFNSKSSFHRAFVKQFGLSPRAFRDQKGNQA